MPEPPAVAGHSSVGCTRAMIKILEADMFNKKKLGLLIVFFFAFGIIVGGLYVHQVAAPADGVVAVVGISESTAQIRNAVPSPR